MMARTIEIDLTDTILPPKRAQEVDPYEALRRRFADQLGRATSLPAGLYEGRIVALFPGPGTDGPGYSVWILEVLKGPFAGLYVKKISDVKDKRSADVFRRELQRVQHDVRNFQELAGKHSEIEGKRVVFCASVNDSGVPEYEVLGLSEVGDASERNRANRDW